MSRPPPAPLRLLLLPLSLPLLLAASALAPPPDAAPQPPADAADAQPQLDWWQTALVYQVYARSFKDSDGDGVGDLAGIAEKVGYLKALGVDAVWLSPIFQSPMADMGRGVSDFTVVDPVFGSLADFERLRDALRAAGIRLLLDLEPSHTSDQHPWFQKSARREEPYAHYYVWADGAPDPAHPTHRAPPNGWVGAHGGSAWAWHEGRRQFYLHQRTAAQPDLNYSNPRVAQEMEAVLRLWAERGADGFHSDAAPLQLGEAALSDEGALQRPGSAALVGDWRALLDRQAQADGRSRVLLLGRGGAGDASAPGAHLLLNDALLAASNASTAPQLRDAVHAWMDRMPLGGWPNWRVGSADTRRVASRVGAELVDAFNALVLLLPGTAVTYYGEEIGMLDNTALTLADCRDPQACEGDEEHYQAQSRDFERTPFHWDDSGPGAGFSRAPRPWLPPAPSSGAGSATAQEAAPRSHLRAYRRVARLRAGGAARRGALNVQAPSVATLALARELPGEETLLLVINMSPEPSLTDLVASFGGDLPEAVSVVAPSVNSDLRVGQQIPTKEVKLPPKASVVFSTKQP